jgi:hypothetical protein
MFFLLLQAYWKLIDFDFCLARGDFAHLHRKVRNYAFRKSASSHASVQKICSAIDVASICYPKQVLCLQRSAATVCLLKRYGFPAQMVIGAQQMPFKAHAWAEVDGRVVNDKSYTPKMYAVLDRC